MADQQGAAGIVVILHRQDAGKPGIGAAQKHGTAALPDQAAVEIQVGIWEGAAAGLCDHAAGRPAKQVGENVPLPGHRALRHQHFRGKSPLREAGADVLQKAGIKVVLILGNEDGDEVFLGGGGQAGDVGAAAPPLGDHSLLLQ